MPRIQPPPEPGGIPPELQKARDERIDVVNYSYLFTGLLGVLLAFILSWYLSSRISRPISELTDATQRIAGGAYGEKVDVRGTEELEELGEAFNTLSEGLAHNETLRKNMIADISHELRTPLTAQRGYLEALEDGVIEPDRKVVEVLMRNNQQLTRLVEDLRQLSLVDAGQLELYPESLEIGVVLHDAAATFERAFDGKGVSLELDIAPALPAVRADRGRVSQVLGNLMANAYLYTPEGGDITLGAKPGQDEVVVYRLRSRAGNSRRRPPLRLRTLLSHRPFAYPGDGRDRPGALHRPRPGGGAGRPHLGRKRTRPGRHHLLRPPSLMGTCFVGSNPTPSARKQGAGLLPGKQLMPAL